METNVNYTLVGAFVIALTAAIILGIVWLSSGFSAQDYSVYKVYMNESVSGLNVDSPVEYNGVNVGSVKSIRINKENPQLVEVLLKIRTKTPITLGTRAKLTVRALSGIAFIALLDRGKDMRPLVVLKGQKYPIIKTIPSILLRLETTLTELTRSFKTISNSVRSLLDQQNLVSIKNSLSNIQRITAAFAVNDANIKNILKNTAQASKEFPSLIRSSEATMKDIQRRTVPAVNQGMADFGNMASDLSDVSSEIKRNPAIIIRGTASPDPGPGE